MSSIKTFLEPWLAQAQAMQASDLHLEPGLPMAVRCRGELQMLGEPVTQQDLAAIAEELIGDEMWPDFCQRQSFDLSRDLGGCRCRVNILCSSRGIGMAVRLLPTERATLARLNLHPDLGKLADRDSGLILVSGATGTGKSSTLAAMLHHIDQIATRHIVTIEAPIEYSFAGTRSFFRQREVGRDTPSFEQALMDALREDPDVLMVGEMRDPTTMRLTLGAAETGHLVLTTLHAATCVEALQRLVTAFAAEIQPSVCAQLADALVAVVSQRLIYRADLGISVPELEILVANNGVRSILRAGQLFKLVTALETGGQDGSFTYARYRDYLAHRKDFYGRPQTPTASRQQELPRA